MRQSKVMKLHMHSLDHLLEKEDESRDQENKPLDHELLFNRSFFMGLVSGIMLEKCKNSKPEELS